jgi:hypothetical protein
VFVADAIPPELRRIVEFLNGQMDPATVLAVEIKQYVGGTLRTLVPRVIGETADAQLKKSSGRTIRQWDEPSFLAALEAAKGEDQKKTAEKIIRWSETRGLRIWWGKGQQSGSCYVMLDHGGAQHYLFAIWTDGGLALHIQNFKGPFEDLSSRIQVVEQLNRIPSFGLTEYNAEKGASVRLHMIGSEEALTQFLTTFDWVIEEIRKT